MLRGSNLREVVESTIRNHPDFGWKPGAADRVVSTITAGGNFSFDSVARALGLERIDPDCYPPPFPQVVPDWL